MGKNGKPERQPRKTDMRNFKNVDSKLANLILNEIVDRYIYTKLHFQVFVSVNYKPELHIKGLPLFITAE